MPSPQLRGRTRRGCPGQQTRSSSLRKSLSVEQRLATPISISEAILLSPRHDHPRLSWRHHPSPSHPQKVPTSPASPDYRIAAATATSVVHAVKADSFSTQWCQPELPPSVNGYCVMVEAEQMDSRPTVYVSNRSVANLIISGMR